MTGAWKSLHCGGLKRECTWRFVSCFVDVAGGCHSKGCVVRGRRSEPAPWMFCFEAKGLDS